MRPLCGSPIPHLVNAHDSLVLSLFEHATTATTATCEQQAGSSRPNADDPLLQNDGGNAVAAELAEDGDGQAEEPINPSQLVSLGSMDPSSGYNLLVVLSSAGASLERVELIEQRSPGKFRYRALEHDGGYLGYLGLQPTADASGLRVRIVPDSSPASRATCTTANGGLQADDIVLELNGQALTSRDALENALRSTKPDQKVDLLVRRGTSELTFSVVLGEAPLDVVRLYPRTTERAAGNFLRPGLLTTVASLNSTAIPEGQAVLPALSKTYDTDWEVAPLNVPGGQGVEFRLPLDSYLQNSGRPSKLDLVKRYRLVPKGQSSDGFLLDLETEIVNRNDQPVSVALRQEGLTGLTLEGWWYSVKISPFMFSGAGQRDVVYNTQLEGHTLATTRQIADRARNPAAGAVASSSPDIFTPLGQPTVLFSELEPPEARQLSYIGLDSQYFNASFLAHPKSPDSLTNLTAAGANVISDPLLMKKSQLQAANSSFWFDTSEQSIPAGDRLSHRYHVYLGPKDTETLEAHLLGPTIEYGWFPWIAKPLSAILHFFHMIVRNYGLAIIMLTVLVRGMMFPLGRKAAMNAQKMQELQPELKKINDMYKDNMEKRAKAMQELYAKHNFKPLAGCLPMFIQLPIFIGLYRCLSVDISLRQQPLIPGVSWCSNLAGPDMLLDWSSWMPEFIAGRGVGWFGPYFNILPMVTVALFLLQQKILMPKATDDQTRMTQNMMMVMTIFMGVLFFKVPSGLCIYFITSSLWSLVERKLVKKFTPPSSSGGGSTTPAPEPPAKPKSTKGSARDQQRRNRLQSDKPDEKPSRFDELRQMLDKPAVRSATQRGSNKQSRGNRKKDKKRRR